MLNHMVQKGSTVLFIAVTLALAGVSLLLAYHGSVERQSFKAFYCAGVAVKERADPYRVEPLRACERRLAPSNLPDGYVEPAPLPGYAMAPFGALAMLSPRLAALLFATLLALAATLSACALVSTSTRSLAALGCGASRISPSIDCTTTEPSERT